MFLFQRTCGLFSFSEVQREIIVECKTLVFSAVGSALRKITRHVEFPEQLS